jgi:hypothetical protein
VKLCVLHSLYDRSLSPMGPHDAVTCTPAHFTNAHTFHHTGLHKATAIAELRRLLGPDGGGFDAFVNLCDGAWDEDRAGVEVVIELERQHAAFTGSGSMFYEPSRDAMKQACLSVGVDTPAHVVVTAPDEIEEALDVLRFPMIVKHPSSYSSIGMGRDARCTTASELRAQVTKNLGAFGGALVEEFVEGREFTVLVADPRASEARPRTWVPVEFAFPEGESFKHFDLKWIEHGSMLASPVRDDALATRLTDEAARFFEALGGTGYGRTDVRMDRDGRLFTLEINPNCGIFYPREAFGSADFILDASPGGHAAFFEHVLETGLARRDRGRPRVRLRRSKIHGFGLVAARDLPTGEIVQHGEAQPVRLVTRSWVERTWSAAERTWFHDYAWPLTDEVFAIWPEAPDAWRPMNHSCDPNTWLDGLDLVARRPIRRGEPITIDYATFCGPTLRTFECACGALPCRGLVRGTDGRLPALRERFGDHVSDFVRRSRA